MSTIIDVARDCGVAISTVSNVLSNNNKKFVSDEIREKVLYSSKKLNYRANIMAKSLVTKRTNLIGFFLTAEKDKFDNFYMSLIAGIGNTASVHGLSPVLYFNILGENDIEELLRSNRGLIDSAIVLTPMENDFRLKELERDNVPYVIIGKPNFSMKKDIPFVDVYNEENTYQITKRLFENGHKNCYFFNGIKEYAISQDRYHGFERALREYGIECADKYVMNISNEAKSLSNIPIVLKKLREELNITAVITESNNTVQYVYDFCKSENLVVGKNFSIASLGSDKNDHRFQDLTTIYVDHYEIGRLATELIVEMEKSPDFRSKGGRYGGSEIVYRTSTNFNPKK